MSRTIAYALDFILDTLDYSPDEATVPSHEADLRLQPSADPMQKDQYAIIIWNDDKHSFDEVIKLISETTGHDKKTAGILAHCIDDAGREIIDISGDVPRLLESAHLMTKIELGVTIRRAYDTFREQVACVIIEWLLDLTRSRLGADTLIIKEIIAAELLSPRRRENTFFTSGPQIPNLAADLARPCRIDWLFVYHTRLWKKPRIHLKAIYASILILSHPHKIAVGTPQRFSLSQAHFNVLQRPTLPASTTVSLTLIYWLTVKQKHPSSISPFNFSLHHPLPCISFLSTIS
jgi:E3 ubiquitin-protein ligase UBR1